MVPVEVQAAGRPVIALGRGGALETVVRDRSCIFFEEQTRESVVGAIRRFESMATFWSPREIQAHARQFSIGEFKRKFMTFYDWCLQRFEAGGPQQVRADLASSPPQHMVPIPSG